MNPFGGGGAGPNDPQSQMMLMSLMEVNEQNLIFFLMSNPDLVENDDNAKFRKSAISFGRNLAAIIVGGTFLNVQMKRIPYINFLSWPKLLRIPFRIPIFFSPFLIVKPQVEDNMKTFFQMHQKYFKRIHVTRRTGDMRYLDPQGILNKQFEQKMKSER